MSHYQADREHRLHAKILFFVSNPDVSLIATLSVLSPSWRERREGRNIDERSAKKGGNRTDDPVRKRIKDDNARIMGSRVIRVDHLAANRGEKKKKRGGEINEERLRATSCQILSLNPSDGSSNSPPSIPPSNRLAIVFVPSRVYAARRESVVADRYYRR